MKYGCRLIGAGLISRIVRTGRGSWISLSGRGRSLGLVAKLEMHVSRSRRHRSR
jgi:hypothetical protein